MKKNPKSGTRRLNNPFPGQPVGLGFVTGELLFDSRSVPAQSHLAGQEFEVEWGAEGVISVHHVTEPNRALWSSVPGRSFVTAALGSDSFEESRGSFAIHDRVELLCSHQTVERVTLAWPSETFAPALKTQGKGAVASLGQDFRFQPPVVDADGAKVGNRGPCVVVSGCLYSELDLAREQIAAFGALSQKDDFPNVLSPFYFPSNERQKLCCLRLGVQKQRVGVRYRMVFYEVRDHQLGFSVFLDQPASFEAFCLAKTAVGLPVSKSIVRGQVGLARSVGNFTDAGPGDRISQCQSIERTHWLWSDAPASAFWKNGKPVNWTGSSSRNGGPRRCISVPDFRTYSLGSNPTSEKSHSVVSDVRRPQMSSVENESLQTLPQLNRIQLTYSTSKTERFFGFGEQFSFFDLKGRRVPILVQEQGIGRGDQPITAAANILSNRSGGSWHTTYAPVPYYMTSEIRSLYLESYEFSVFDLTRPNLVQVQIHAGHVQGRILHGRTPADIIKQYTAAVGRMRELPAWILGGAVVGMQGGTDAVRRVWQKLKEHDVPIAAFWLQDWVGQRKTSVGWQLWWNWELDRDHYHGWEELVGDFRASGIRTMAYCNAFLTPSHEKMNLGKNLFEEARSEDYLVNDQRGLPYMITNTSFDSAMVDLTNPAARSWLKSVLRRMLDIGVSGWMADFGEALPLDCTVYSGEEPRVLHNKYPELWAELNREVAEEWETVQRQRKTLEAGVGGDEEEDEKLVFFMRAAYRGSPRSSTLFWLGDQMVSWQRHDGIKSAVTGLLTGGLCGFSFNHSDIGGYSTVDVPLLRYRRSEELLLRWMEINAFSTIFRTHEGNAPDSNWQFYSSITTLRFFPDAREYTKLGNSIVKNW